MSRGKKILRLAVIGTTGAIVFIGLASGLWLFRFWLFLKTPAGIDTELRYINIADGMTAHKVARLLYDSGVVGSAERFYLLCRLRGVDRQLKAGDYAFHPYSTPENILKEIVTGKALVHRVTVPEGVKLSQLAHIIDREGLAPVEQILNLAGDQHLIRSLGLHVSSLEGYLFPETYFFRKTVTGSDILRTMVEEFWKHLPDEWEKQAESLGMSLHEIVIMASLVEKEAKLDRERPIIAGVFYNRLRSNMPLQSDPTAVYDLPDFSGTITSDHLKRQSPYNTYQRLGLPIGPICNPGEKSLRAALYPEKNPYLYFVSNNDGTHHFSAFLAEHNQAVLEYRKKRSNASALFPADLSEHAQAGQTNRNSKIHGNISCEEDLADYAR